MLHRTGWAGSRASRLSHPNRPRPENRLMYHRGGAHRKGEMARIAGVEYLCGRRAGSSRLRATRRRRGGNMSVREQERRQKEAQRRIDKVMRRADKETRREIEARAGAADKRMRQVIRRIEKGDVEPRPLPGVREDSMESMESMPSMESMESMKSMESADYATEVTEEEADAGRMMQDMPLQGH